MSAGERILWSRIRRDQLGFRFKRQVPMKTYFLDFCCPAAMLCLEVDGEQHVPEEDARRDQNLLELGIVTVRIPSLEVFDRDSLRGWLDTIYRLCVERSGHEPFPEPGP
jgi:very-short-patch-repair endonuclease